MSSRIRSDFGTLAQRSARMRGEQEPAVVFEGEDAGPALPAPRQRWVLVDGEEQAIIARWRRGDDGRWEGLVARAGGADDLYAQWLPAQRLSVPDVPVSPDPADSVTA